MSNDATGSPQETQIGLCLSWNIIRDVEVRLRLVRLQFFCFSEATGRPDIKTLYGQVSMR